MQAQTLPISTSTANATPAPARGPAADAATDASTPFAEALSREIGQRRQAAAPAEAAPAQDARPTPGARSAAQSRETAADAAQAAIAADAAAVDPVTDMLALAASIAQPAAAVPASAETPATAVPAAAATAAQLPTAGAGAAANANAVPAHASPQAERPVSVSASPLAASQELTASTAPLASSAAAPAKIATDKMGSDPISTAASINMVAGKMGSDPILATGKMGSDPILATGKMASDPISEATVVASPASAMFAQALGTVQAQAEGAAQVRSMFATASAQVAQAPGAGLSSDAAALSSDPLLGVVVQPQARAAVQATPAQASELHQDMASLPSAGAGTAPEPATTEAPRDASFATQLQAARAETLPANQLVGGDRLPARVGTPAWDKQLGQKIVFMAAGAEQSASLTLNPPDLGPVQVVLNISNDQASVAFSSSQLEVRQALEHAMPKLREMMGESGITLGNATVNAGMPEQQQQAQRGQDARAGGQHGNARGNGNGAGGDDVPAAPVRRVALGAVDTFA